MASPTSSGLKVRLSALMLSAGLASCLTGTVASARVGRAAFDLVPLGVQGGLVEGATTAWFVAPHKGGTGVACDAGTLVPGIEAAIARRAFAGATSAADVLHTHIAAYLVTHPHLDHVAGLVMASPDDTPKPIYALEAVNDALAANYFNWSAWPNMGDRGKPPLLRRYRYRDLAPGAPAVAVEATALSVTAYPLSHGGTLSTAFLIHSGRDAILCMGDTGPDQVEHSNHLDALWRAIAPIVREGRLRAIIVEASYPDPRKDGELYGHLTPRWLGLELARLAAVVESPARMKDLTVIVGHIKPSLDAPQAAARQIAAQLQAATFPPVRYRIAVQGRRLEL